MDPPIPENVIEGWGWMMVQLGLTGNQLGSYVMKGTCLDPCFVFQINSRGCDGLESVV